MFCSIWAVGNILKFLYNVLYSAQSFQDNRITSWLLLCTISKPLLGCLQTQGRIQDFFQGRGALVSCSTSTPINHIVFFFRRIPVVLENRRSSRGGVRTPCTLPLDPSLRHRFCHIVTFSIKSLVFQVKTSHIILCSTIFGMSLCHHVVKLGNAGQLPQMAMQSLC